MSFQWLTMRIGEEKDRRAREAQILGRLPGAIDDLQRHLSTCIDEFAAAFGQDVARIAKTDRGLEVSAGAAGVEVVTDQELPGFQVRHTESTLAVQVGVLPGGKLFYFDAAADKYLSMEDLTRNILDRVLFPKLRD
jgi:hypothetical protein